MNFSREALRDRPAGKRVKSAGDGSKRNRHFIMYQCQYRFLQNLGQQRLSESCLSNTQYHARLDRSEVAIVLNRVTAPEIVCLRFRVLLPNK